MDLFVIDILYTVVVQSGFVPG